MVDPDVDMKVKWNKKKNQLLITILHYTKNEVFH